MVTRHKKTTKGLFMLAQKHHIICTVALALLTISVALHSSQEPLSDTAYQNNAETGQELAPAPLLVAKICAATWLRWQRAALLNDLNHKNDNGINNETIHRN